ncbi:MAG: hypothetical protein H6Q07_2042 [Acidobacteria bacterium]|nr:hypothetical protein [Acidobacteriota bacterium]
MKPFIANSMWFASCLPETMAFRRATCDVARAQRRALQRITGFTDVDAFREHYALSEEPGTPQEPIVRRLPTSGTTGPTKWIPYTESLYMEFRRGIAPWIVDLMLHNPNLLAGKSYWAISPIGPTGSGFGDDTEYLGRAQRWIASTLAVPASVRRIRDLEQWRIETLRHLMACRDLTFISVWHPTFLLLLLQGLEKPSRLWPKLRVISCWGDSPELKEMFPKAEIQPKGLIATEGFVSLPLWERNGAALAERTHFFEFLDGGGKPFGAHELAAGNEYSVVLTTGGGLNRYRLHDLVRVTGFENECPLLRFIGKDNIVSDRFGEKVSEHQVRCALKDLAAKFLLVACEGKAYTLYVESFNPDYELAAWGEALELSLCRNVHYRYCRGLRQLERVRVVRIGRNSRIRYLAACQSRGRRLGDVKPVLLERTGGWMSVFEAKPVISKFGQ